MTCEKHDFHVTYILGHCDVNISEGERAFFKNVLVNRRLLDRVYVAQLIYINLVSTDISFHYTVYLIVKPPIPYHCPLFMVFSFYYVLLKGSLV